MTCIYTHTQTQSHTEILYHVHMCIIAMCMWRQVTNAIKNGNKVSKF